MDNNKLPNKGFLDLATVLTVAGILLYYLGWMYWEKYFITLSIKPSLIDLSFDKIIVTTWLTVISLIISFTFTFQQVFHVNRYQKEIEICNLILLFLTSIFISLTSKFQNYGWWFYFVTLAIFLVIKLLQRNRKFPLVYLSKKKSIVFIFIGIYLFGIYYYRDRGEKDALEIKNKYAEDIILKLSDDKKLYGKFVIYMNNKYFLIVEDSNCKKETLIINDSEVKQAKFIE